MGTFGRSGDETCQVEILFSVKARHLRGFAAEKTASVFPTSFGKALHNFGKGFGLQFPCGEIVHEVERTRALNQNIVDAMVDQVLPDRVVYTGHEGDPQFRPHPVGAGDQIGVLHPLRKGEHSAETADLAASLVVLRQNGLDQLNRPVPFVDIHAGVFVGYG